MTKEQLITKYGIEWYEAYKVKCRQRKKARYDTDAEYREAYKVKHNAYCKERYDNDAEYREAKRKYNRERRMNLEYCEAKRKYNRDKAKERYANDVRYRETLNAKHNAYRKERYVIGGRIDLVENYDKAKVNNFKGWHIHHRLELHPDYSVRFTRESLIELNLYYNRPPNELIWLTKSEHRRLHNLGRKYEKGKA